MSQPPLSSPPPGPPKSSGMSTVMIVLIVFGLLGLVCCGGCVGCVYFGGQGAIGLGLMEGAMQRIRTNQQVSDKFGGTPTATYTASKLSLQEGSTSTVDFELSGPKGK